MKPRGQAELIIVLLLLVIVVTIGLLIANGGIGPRHTPTPSYTVAPIVTETVTPGVIYNPTVTATSDYTAPTQTATISPTLTSASTPQLTWEPTLPVWTVTPAPPPMPLAIVRDCAPKLAWQPCYWRCCDE